MYGAAPPLTRERKRYEINMDPIISTPETAPATIPIDKAPSVSSYRQARAEGKTEIPNPAAKAPAPVADDAPDPEIEGDPELKAAIDEVEAPKAEETPAEKRLRTIRNKEAGKKSITTRFKNQRDAARLELEDWRNGRRTYQAATTAAPAAPVIPATQPAVKADDLEPKLEDFATKDDPYLEWNKAHNRWSARQVVNEHEASASEARQKLAREQAHAESVNRFHDSADELRKTTPTYDAAIGPFLERHKGAPTEGPLMAAILQAEAPAAFAFYVASKPDAEARLVAAARMGSAAFYRAVGTVEYEISAAARTSAPAAKPEIQLPPAPHQPGGGGSTAAGVTDPSKMSLRDFRNGGRERVLARR